METVSILIECPKNVQVEIEEICINKGISFTEYFLTLHQQFELVDELEESSMEETPRKGKKK